MHDILSSFLHGKVRDISRDFALYVRTTGVDTESLPKDWGEREKGVGKMKNMKQTLVIAGVVALAPTLAAPQAGFPVPFVSTAEAHILSSDAERDIGMEAVQEFESKYETYVDEDLLTIQNRLVVCNPDKLNMEDGAHTRWLYPMKAVKDNVPNAVMFPAGHAYYNDGMVKFLNTRMNDGFLDHGDLRPMNGANIYNTSAVAFVMGHEFGHWAGEDFLESYDKQFGVSTLLGIFGGGATSAIGVAAQNLGVNLVDTLVDRQMSFNQEKGADVWGVQFIENVPEYSIGGALMKFDRYMKLEQIDHPDGKLPVDFRNPHSKTPKRFERVMDYVKKSSEGRVEIKEGELYLDGTHIPVVRTGEVEQLERVYYIAGQLATAIKKGIFHRVNISYIPVASHPSAGDPASKDSYIVVRDRNTGAEKILDKLRFDTRSAAMEDYAASEDADAHADYEEAKAIADAAAAYDEKHPKCPLNVKGGTEK